MILIDTHIFVDLMLGLALRFSEEYASARLGVSAVTAAELGCLQRLGRLRFDLPADRWFEAATIAGAVAVLPVPAGQLARAMLDPWAHRDPGDRILVQHLRERADLELHTRDGTIVDYAREQGLRVRDCR